MTNELADASEALRAASELADQHRDRLYERSNALAELAAGDAQVDHGRLARETTKLHEIEGDLADESAELVEQARELIAAYREDLEGV
ncbi:DUF7553 family protein [Natranaeroarchaeum sulfidigenes]|uniref:Uncharacterized protein n=1 Tax=Natranaeroarchaeum sulfidigenes TaxID=2784880 RepID=A0A897MLT0_9EURY|nr:hypothetical protein [Natranaeroarchaeum sulfidigenes]QSG01321.1 Uncharacterized protein AArcS_0081 [Natranaeroarchaeum sulfidigenes]